MDLPGLQTADCGRRRHVTDLWLSRQLRAYGVRPRNIRDGERVAKGYVWEEMEDVVRRYVPMYEVDAFMADLRRREAEREQEKAGPTRTGLWSYLDRSMNSLQPQNLFPLRCDHRMMPLRFPHDLHIRLFDTREPQQPLLRITGNHTSHPATRRSQSHFDRDATASARQRHDFHVVHQSEIDDVHRNLRVVTRTQGLPDILFRNRAVG